MICCMLVCLNLVVQTAERQLDVLYWMSGYMLLVFSFFPPAQKSLLKQQSGESD